MKKIYRSIFLITFTLSITGCSLNNQNNSSALDKIKNIEWQKLTADMVTISGAPTDIMDNMQASLKKVKSYRSQAIWKVHRRNSLGWDSVELWATFVRPDKLILRYHNVPTNEWDEQVFIGNQRFSHFNQITERTTNKAREYKDAYVPIDDRNFKETIDNIAYVMSLEKCTDLFQNTSIKGMKIWEDNTKYIVSFIVIDWEAFIGTGKRAYVFWMLVEKNTLHPQQIKIQSASDGDVGRELLQTFYDYDENISIEEPRPEQFLKTAENKSHKALNDFKDVSGWVTYYYKDLDLDNLVLAVKIVSNEDKIVNNLNHAWPVVHFFAAALQADKTKIDSIKTLMEQSGNKQQEFLRRVINEAENFKSIVPNDPNDLDCLWSEFMATGKEEPVQKILKTLSYTTQDIDLSSLVWRMEGISSKQQALAILKNAAIWSLTANARHHPRVYEILNKEMLETEDMALKKEISQILKSK